MTYLILYN